MPRHRSTPHTFEQKIAEAKDRFLTQASKLAPGPQLDEIQQKLSQLETAAHLSMMLSARPSKEHCK
jgi:hypothetical protein